METRPPAHAIERAAKTIEDWSCGQRASQGFYIPYRYAASTHNAGAPPWLLNKLHDAGAQMDDWLDAARALNGDLARYATANAGKPHNPRFDQEWFTGLDATLAYTMVRELAPSRIIEVGSGHSTRFMARAIEDGGLRTSFTSIDPEPRRDIDTLCTTVERRPLDVDALPVFDQLMSGDILFIDGSHILMPGTDVEFLFTHIIPVLPAGCVVHIHDIFAPDPYPQPWQWRGYNEQALCVALLGSGRLEVLAASAWLRGHCPHKLNDVFAPCSDGGYESSLWVRIAS
jgi:predicted O-methyltransferase YrrM